MNVGFESENIHSFTHSLKEYIVDSLDVFRLLLISVLLFRSDA